MDQDATWYGGKLRPRRRCIRWGRSSPVKRHSPQFSAHVYCGQTAGWMKTPLGTEVDLGQGHIVLDGVPAPPREEHCSTPLFGPCLLRPRSPISATAEFLYKGSAVAEMGERGLHRHGPKSGGCCAPFAGAGTPSSTMWPWPGSTSVPSGVFIHLAVWPQ